MLNLFKYNWKKSEILYYSLLGATILLYTVLYIVSRRYDWWGEFTVLGALSIASTALQALTIVVVYNINASLKSTSRRLLPVKAIHEYLAHLATPTIYSVSFGILCWLFFILVKDTIYFEEARIVADQLLMTSSAISMLLSLVLYSVFNAVFFLFAITIARLSRSNLKILIFIGVLIGVSFIYGLLTTIFNTNPNVTQQGWIRLEVTDNLQFKMNFFSLSWLQLVELIFGFVLAYVSVYIMKNKIEV